VPNTREFILSPNSLEEKRGGGQAMSGLPLREDWLSVSLISYHVKSIFLNYKEAVFVGPTSKAF